MKKFKFGLETVLRYRETIEEHEKNLLTELNGEMAQLSGELEELRRQCRKTVSDFEQAAKNGMTAHEIVSQQVIIKNIEYAIEDKLHEISEHQKKIDRQTTVVIRATQDKKTLDKLKESSLKEYNKAVAKADEQFIEEYVSFQERMSTT